MAEEIGVAYLSVKPKMSGDFDSEVNALIAETMREHKRIIFNGNGYDDEWIKEAERRGLYNLPTTPDCLPYMISEKNVKLFEDHKVFTREELEEIIDKLPYVAESLVFGYPKDDDLIVLGQKGINYFTDKGYNIIKKVKRGT